MNGYLVDTNVLSELTKPVPSAELQPFLRKSKARVSVSVVSIGEIRKGIASLPHGNRRAALEDWLDNEIRPGFTDRVLPLTLEAAEKWGELSAALKAKGRPRPVVDTMLAATALTHHLILVTRNVKDFEDITATLLDPWKPAWNSSLLTYCHCRMEPVSRFPTFSRLNIPRPQ